MGSLITILNIDKTKKLFFGPNQHIRMISEGSWHTEDWTMNIKELVYVSKVLTGTVNIKLNIF